MSAVLAGYCLFRFSAFTAGNQLVVPYLLAAGALLAMADSAWRLIFAAAADAEPDNPFNPHAGLVSPTGSFFVASFTTLAGVMCAMTGGYGSFRIAGVMVILMLARSALFRTTEIVSPILAGISTAMLFVIGMTAHPTFAEMMYIGEARLPVAFFAAYMIVVAVLSQVRDSSRPREAPSGEELSSETASRLLEMRDDAIDRSVVWFGGAALVLIPLVLAWVMPLRWLSCTFLVFLSLSTLTKLIPVLVYRTRKDLESFIESVYRGGAFLNAGGVASLGEYRLREIYDGWFIPMPGRDEQLILVLAIALLSTPAWMFRRAAPVD